MKTATVFNHAGGAGKTSITRDVGYELAQQGHRVLLIDLDPQANLSSWLGVEEVDLGQTAFPVLTENAPLPTPLERYGLHLIPSHVDLAMAEAMVLGQPGAHYRLQNALEAVRDQYDVVLIDSPPSIGQLAIIGAGAADDLLVPIPTRTKGLNALPGLRKSVSLYRQLRRDLNVSLYIPTMYDARRNHDKEVLGALREGLHPLAEPVPQREAVWLDSNMAGQPVGVYAPNSPVHADVRQLTAQVAQALKLRWS
ncbi:ParA family protein [Deinococcus cavernae]|uniref:ParA family protein n=1 Tax=Deinococcus cavernae TaxID=2320857 RepID=A0A418VFN1_9DEIO|nr:ParA family protein [Deinococcus cavernae]RJF74876.1 ParA family protein [Deinococcus cavernae]